MNKDAQKIIGWLTVLFVGIASLFIWVTWEQETVGGADAPSPTDPVTVTPTDAPVKIVFEEGVPIAVAFTHTPSPTPLPTPTNTPTATPTPTDMPPTPTEKPVERIATPKATNTPTATATPVIRNSVAYPTGAVGTQYTDDKNAHTWKPYARYWKITKKGTPEYKLRCMETTAENGLRIVQDPNGVWRCCIALEPRWAGGQDVDIGRCIDIQMTNGSVLHCVLADCKRTEKSYNQEGWYGSRGELIEFIADETKLPSWVNGDISKLSKEFDGGIISVTVLDLYIKGFGKEN